MAGNNNNKNKKGMRKRSEQEKAKVAKEDECKAVNLAHGPPCPTEDDKVANGPPYPTEDDNTKILNDKLVKEITRVREENVVLSTNLTEMRSEIESARRSTEEWKETEKESRKELGRKDAKYQAAISQAGKQLLEADERFNTEISAKEDECKAVNLDKKNLEATVLQLKNQIEARSAELEETNKGRKLEKDMLLSQIAAAEKQTAEITRSSQMAQEAFNAEKEHLLNRLAQLQTNLELTVSENGSLSETNRELTTEAESVKAHLNEYSEKLVRMEDEKKALEAISVSRAERLEDLLKQNATMEKEHARKYGEYQAAISQAGKQLLEAEERFNTEISAKEDECKAVNLDKRNLEAIVLQLKNQIEARSAELEANNRGRKLEKDVLLTQIGAAKEETAEITRSSQTAQEAFNAEKENLLSRHAELQKNLELMANAKQSLSETYRELKTEGESLKAQLNEYSEKLVSMEDEKQALEDVCVSKAERFDALLKQNATLEKEISSLQQQVDENVKQHSHVIQQYKVEENSLKQQIEMLEKEVLTAQCWLEIRDKSIYERIVENGKLSNQVEELSKTIVQLQEANVNLVQEKDELKKEFESLHTESVKKYEEMEEKHSELFKEKEEQAKTINSLQGQINSLMESVKKYKVMEEKHSELFKEKEEHAKTINSLQGEINSLMESVKKYKVMEEKHSELFKEKEEQAKTINSLQGEINSLKESVQKYKVMEEKHSELFKEKEEQAKTINSLQGEINSLMESIKKYKVMEEKYSELFKEKEEREKTINSLPKINSLMESIQKYKVMEKKHSELFKEKEEQEKTINSLRGEINSVMESVKNYKVIEEKHSELFKEKEEQAKTINSLRGKINSLIESVKKYKVMEEKHSELFKEKQEQAKTINSLLGEIKWKKVRLATKKHEDFLEKCIQSQNPTIAQEKRIELLDTVKYMDVHKKDRVT